MYRRILAIFLCFCAGILLTGCRESIPKAELETIITTSTTELQTESMTAPEKNYIANKNSGKLHSTNCDSLPYEKNRIYFSTIEQAHNAGYTDHHRECMGG